VASFFDFAISASYASFGHLGFPHRVYRMEKVVYKVAMSLHIVSGDPFDSGV
jgi:hypothetical protein